MRTSFVGPPTCTWTQVAPLHSALLTRPAELVMLADARTPPNLNAGLLTSKVYAPPDNPSTAFGWSNSVPDWRHLETTNYLFRWSRQIHEVEGPA